jgi:hypothetical protein
MLPGVDEVLSDFAEPDVEVLGGASQDVEGLLGAAAFAFHEDALGLSDDLATCEGRVKVVQPALVVFMGRGRGEGHGGKPGEENASGPVNDPEGPWVAGVEVESSEGTTVGEQGYR